MGDARYVVVATLALLSAAMVPTAAMPAGTASARGVPEFGCAQVETNRTFGKVADTDCAPGAESACFDQMVDPPVAVDTHAYPSNCKWVSAESSNTVTTATCPAGSFVFSGGCSFGSDLGASSPWEGDPTNVPDPGEAFFYVDEPNGWMCVPTGGSFTVTLTSAVALCCEQHPEIPALRETLQDCGWSNSPLNSDGGGVFAPCPTWTVPVTSGLHGPNIGVDVPPPLLVLAPAGWWGSADGFVDGEPLANDHPGLHGEPPEDDTSLSAYVGDLATTKGTGKHPESHDTTQFQKVLTLCCGVPPPPPHASAQKYPYGGGKSVPRRFRPLPGAPKHLTSCVYERALLTPVADGGNSPQHVAKLACRNGTHVVSGGCYAQFYHGRANADLAGSYPYENGDVNDLPNSGTAQSEVSGENGWACRLDRAPQIFLSGPAKVAVEAICCL